MNEISEKPRTILLVDDDPDDREMFGEALQIVDGTVEYLAVEDGVEALRLLRTEKERLPDIIFLDLNMPRMDGKQCLAEIRKTDHLQRIPVIIYTTSKHPKDIEETKQLGANCFITKPFHFDEICKSITYVLERDWQHEEAG